jgi:thiamine biosynthesis protein ThiS
MELIINGQLKILDDVQTLADIVAHYRLNDKIIVIEHNLEIVAREQYGEVKVAPGDKIEIVHFVGGG